MYIGKRFGTIASGFVGYWMTDQAQLLPYGSSVETPVEKQLEIRKIKWQHVKDETESGNINAAAFALKYLGWIQASMRGGVMTLECVGKRIAPRAVNVCNRWIENVLTEQDLVSFTLSITNPKTGSKHQQHFDSAEKLKLVLAENTVRRVMDPAIITAARKRIAAFLLSIAASDEYSKAKQARDALQAECDRYSKILRKYPKQENGLTPDTVKFSPEYRNDKRNYDHAFQQLRSFNAHFVKTYKKDIRGDGRLRGNIVESALPFTPDSFLRRMESVVQLYLRPGTPAEKDAARSRIEAMLETVNKELEANKESEKLSAKEISSFLDKLQKILDRVPEDENAVKEVKDLDLEDDPDHIHDWPDFGKGDWVYDMHTRHFAYVLNTPTEERVTVKFLVPGLGWQTPVTIRNPVMRLGRASNRQNTEIHELLMKYSGK
jgi:hypothetical protein